MSVSESQPVSVGDLDAILPLPISAGGTGSTTAGDAIVALGIDQFVATYVENYYDIKDSVWKGSASGKVSGDFKEGNRMTLTIRQTESSANIAISGNAINFAKPGTYSIRASVSCSNSYASYPNGTAGIYLTNGRRIYGVGLGLHGGTSSMNVSVTFGAAATVGLYAQVESGYGGNTSIGMTDIQINRTS